ncbi:uncharacterized protein BDZ83DRAFT_655500 [Colletotrichum acutatum]|uniref:Uncharacterized protein n=1 Tax=Glomerella acutata TaxID=27357 RepID=A0AAD8XBX5_GLOAC|nr:uncharacterized protein BDZ83DRAFT_655500 [Colletotrichum acutatum]KAK1716726.1 hypothetical protein BDZ83DRAFT_655500 [Colletotrichum acutatum]
MVCLSMRHRNRSGWCWWLAAAQVSNFCLDTEPTYLTGIDPCLTFRLPATLVPVPPTASFPLPMPAMHTLPNTSGCLIIPEDASGKIFEKRNKRSAGIASITENAYRSRASASVRSHRPTRSLTPQLLVRPSNFKACSSVLGPCPSSVPVHIRADTESQSYPGNIIPTLRISATLSFGYPTLF